MVRIYGAGQTFEQLDQLTGAYPVLMLQLRSEFHISKRDKSSINSYKPTCEVILGCSEQALAGTCVTSAFQIRMECATKYQHSYSCSNASVGLILHRVPINYVRHISKVVAGVFKYAIYRMSNR